MGYYYDGPPPDKEQPPGCLDALLITRAVFAVLMWPALAMVVVIADLGVIAWAYTVHPALALIPAAVTGVALWLVAKWDQTRNRPPGL